MDLEEIKQGLSTEKLETYRQVLSCKSDGELIGVYMAMQSIMSHFFTVVQLLEVTLRNSIHKAASERFDDDEWFRSIPTSEQSKIQVEFAEEQCLDEVGVKYSTDDLVSRLPFGFWVHMLSRSYNNPRDKECNLWQFKFNDCFPNAKEHKVSLNTIFQKLGILNRFRNRLFHHEPAWKGRKTKNRVESIQYLLKIYQEHLDVIYFLSASKRDLIAILGFEEKFIVECNVASLEKFESLLTPEEGSDPKQNNEQKEEVENS
ncbi:hypothetical protein [Thalassotalea marina]|uniref:Abi-like protein n=1 Tax=Thalassotalea marina TaxID=1673741 RepID=A0A919BRJ7_9GAMM|nr:hypothetical protein [Thalassotalea marina]GHG07746.1 hypothetical protein GCM10017161_41810 [Thalassotalea marina]